LLDLRLVNPGSALINVGAYDFKKLGNIKAKTEYPRIINEVVKGIIGKVQPTKIHFPIHYLPCSGDSTAD